MEPSPATLTKHDPGLAALLVLRSLAVIGATDREGSVGRAVLGPFLGHPPRDVRALRDCLLRLSRLMTDFPAI